MVAKQRWLMIFVAYFITVSVFPTSILAEEPNIKSESAVLIDGKTGQILYEKNSSKEMYPASITKIVTAILAIESGNLSEPVEVSSRAREVDGTRVYLAEGETLPLEKLVKGMMINSGNDAAVAIAEHLSGSVEAFADEMNAFAENELNLEDTHFTNPHGLFNENHVTTASDMAKITQYAMKNEEYRAIAGLKEMDWKGEEWDTTLINHHRLLLDYDYVTGGKNGYVSKSGFTLVTSASQDDRELIAVTMKASSNNTAYQDTLRLLNYGFNEFSPVVYKEGTEIGTLEDTNYTLSKDLTLLNNSDGEPELTITKEGVMESNIGSITSILDSSLLASKSLKEDSSTKVEEVASVKKADEKNESNNEWLNLAILLIGIGMFIFILLALFLSKKSSSRRRSRTFP
ncbi:D-alanyl-D-alanine carboxypeptidase family protein [Guptibacillus algicola]|uniref:D-alanyl-D-alanine carboxypeptidase family protein n=1 Tax=Guptibacillus algicola TaxID=225844 RepID=UPI001CD517FB|nr:D-alanyl-D-alanine carboxypeptidase family protein [Alkalihalobacillus algicola]MCA0985732.1 D-alanyl-D-alanine carboxypeptidase [Alkalihalobacillus algicola]